MRKLLVVFAFAVVAGLIAGCSPQGAATTDKPATDKGTTTDSPPEPQPNGAAIRDVDLSTLAWHDTPRNTDVTLTGAAPVGDVFSGQYSRGDLEPVYSDVNGDGFDDVLASLKRVEGNGLDELWYVWLWDAKAEAPRQLLDPVARQERCATVVEATSALEGAFQITERHRDLADIGTCDAEPPNAVTRTIKVVDDRLVQTEGYGGYGGICPQPRAGDADSALIEDYKLYTAPAVEAARVEGDDIYWISALPTGSSPWLEVDGWVLIGFGPSAGSTTFDEYGPYIPCAWAQRPE